jgi:Uma2 family endonuclease
MAAHAFPQLTAEEYLSLERGSEQRHEFYGGVMYAMSGGSRSHALIIVNFGAELRNSLRTGPCSVTVSDLRVCVDPNRIYVYPDIVVACEPHEFLNDGKGDTLLNPSVVIEVLSPSTQSYDQGAKRHRYQTIASLHEYAVVWQTEARVEIYRRGPGADWTVSNYSGLNEVCEFRGLPTGPVRVSLADIYERVTFDPPAELA